MSPPALWRVAALGLATLLALDSGAPPARAGVTRTAGANDSGSSPAPPGSPHFAVLGSLEGLPSGAATRAFMEGFRGAFSAQMLDTERDTFGRVVPDVPLSNRFRLLEGSTSTDAFRIDVTFRLDSTRAGAPRDAKSGGRATRRSPKTVFLEAAVAWTEPGATSDGTTATAASRLRFAPPSSSGTPFARDTGRDVGLLALEGLHHRSGDLEPELRLILGRGTRSPPTQP